MYVLSSWEFKLILDGSHLDLDFMLPFFCGRIEYGRNGALSADTRWRNPDMRNGLRSSRKIPQSGNFSHLPFLIRSSCPSIFLGPDK